MSEWMNFDEELTPGSLDAVEDLLRLAADDVPPVRSGLRTEIVTRAQKMQREVRLQQKVWGFVTLALLFAAALIWGPVSSEFSLASRTRNAPQPIKASIPLDTDSVDWELVESKKELRERNLEILRNAF